MIDGVGEKGNIGGNEALGEARRNGVQSQVDRNPELAGHVSMCTGPGQRGQARCHPQRMGSCC